MVQHLLKKSASLEQLSGPCSVSSTLKVFQDRGTTAISGKSIPVFDHPHGKKFILISTWICFFVTTCVLSLILMLHTYIFSPLSTQVAEDKSKFPP